MKALASLPIGPKARRDRLVELVGKAKPRDLPALVIACETFVRNSPALAAEVIAALADRAPDAQIAELGVRLGASPPPTTSNKLARAFAKLVKRHGGTPAKAAPHARPAPDPGPLLAEVIAQPDDDGPREVYADWLTERGDIRGELITLQLAKMRGKPSAEAKQREKELLANHKTALLGPFAACAKRTGLAFERGFLVAAIASTDWPAVPENALIASLDLEHHALALDVELTSLHELANYEHPIEQVLARAPRLRAVRYLRTYELQDLEILTRAPRSVDDITISTWGATPTRLGFEALVASTLAREATRLEIRASWPNETTPAMLLAKVPATCTTFVFDVVSHVEMRFEFARTQAGWALAAQIAKTRQLPRMADELARAVAGLPPLVEATFVAKLATARAGIARAVSSIPNAIVR